MVRWADDKKKRMRATICVMVDEPSDVATVERWFATWGEELTYCSKNTGCGCCVNIWDVEGPADAIEALPESVLAASDWAGLGGKED